MGWLIALAIIVLIGILPLGVSARYNDSGPLIRVIAGPVRFTVFPGKKKEKSEKKEKPKKEKKAPSEKKQKPAKEKKPKPAEEKKGGSILDFLPLVPVVLDFLGKFFGKMLHFDRLELKLVLGGGDPCDLAVNYGKAWMAMGNLLPQLDRMLTIKKRDVDIQCSFEADETTIYAQLDLTLTLGRLLGLVFATAFRALCVFVKIMNSRKGGAVK